MTPPILALIVLVCVFGSAAFGLWLRNVLPEQHLTTETKEIVRLSTGLIATIAALVLSLLVSAAKGSFDRFSDELTENAARVLLLDRALAEYGPETGEVRALIKAAYARRIDLLFSGNAARENKVDGPHLTLRDESIDTRLLALVPASPVQQGLQSRAVDLNSQIDMTRALMHVQREETIPFALLVVLVTWLSVIFAAFGLFAPRNGLVLSALFVCSLSAAGAVLLILEMNSPFTGIMNISSAPMRETLSHLGE